MLNIVSHYFDSKSYTLKRDVLINRISDIHAGNNSFLTEDLEEILKEMKSENPDYLCIVGDLIDDTEKIKFNPDYKTLLDFLKKAREYTKRYVLVSKGDHEFVTKTTSGRLIKENEKLFSDLRKIEGIEVLDNRSFYDKSTEINFYGFMPKPERDEKNNSFEKKKPSYETLAKEINELFPTVDKNKINILLSHLPQILSEENRSNIELMKEITLVLCGHMQCGMIPEYLENLESVNNNKGIFGPYNSLFPDLARGIVKFDQLGYSGRYGIIGAPISTINTKIELINKIVHKIYPPTMDKIYIRKHKRD